MKHTKEHKFRLYFCNCDYRRMFEGNFICDLPPNKDCALTDWEICHDQAIEYAKAVKK